MAGQKLSWNHFCLCSSRPLEGLIFDDTVQCILHVAQRILCRGEAPPVQPEFENELLMCPPGPWERPAHDVDWTSPDGSAEEEKFFREIVPTLLSPSILRYLHCQVPFNALTDEVSQTDNWRIDFVVLHPALNGKGIAIEIDGDQHRVETQVLLDAKRDRLLRAAGYEVLRIPASEIRDVEGSALRRLDGLGAANSNLLNPDHRIVAGVQVQLALLQLVFSQALETSAETWKIVVHGPFCDALEQGIFQFKLLLTALEELFGAKILPGRFDVSRTDHVDPALLAPEDILLDWSAIPWYQRISSHRGTRARVVSLRPIWLPTLTPLPLPPQGWVEPKQTVSTTSLERLLRAAFPRFREFQPGQEEGVRRCLAGSDSLVLLPTGAGKSLIFQLSSILLPGLSLVVAPLVSLMEDQVDNLRRNGIDRVSTITSTDSIRGLVGQKIDLLRHGAFYLCYVAPERLQIQSFRDELTSLRLGMSIPLVVVDEAHCVSEWGHDFRTAYLNIGRIARTFGSRGGRIPSIIGLTGTASRAVLRDVQRELGITDLEAVIVPDSFDRPELDFEVVHSPSSNKENILRGVINAMPQRLRMMPGEFHSDRGESTVCGIVFCPHVNGEYGVLQVAERVADYIRQGVGTYAGKLEPEQKTRAASQFKDNKHRLLVATKAFGMGIDKPNVRYTVHYQLPPSLEAFYQEAGRAGRDRRHSHCVVISSVESEEQARSLLSPSADADGLRREYQRLSDDPSRRDDIIRNLYFHTVAFEGVETDVDAVRMTLAALSDIEEAGTDSISFRPEGQDERAKKNPSERELADDSGLLPRRTLERAIHRLLLLDVVEDYTVDYSARRVQVHRRAVSEESLRNALDSYVSAYSRARAQKVLSDLPVARSPDLSQRVVDYAGALVTFIYSTIEAGRRAAIGAVWRWASEDRSSEDLREHLLNYLQETESVRDVFTILRDDDFNYELWSALLEYIASARELAELETALSRATEDHPDHPLLLASRAVVLSLKREPRERVAEDVSAALGYLRSRYLDDPSDVCRFSSWLLRQITRSDEAYQQIAAFQLCESGDKTVTNYILSPGIPDAMKLGAVPALLREIGGHLKTMNDAMLVDDR